MANSVPKLPEQRRRRNVPERGEWVDLEPLEAPILPEYDPEWEVDEWVWNGWRESPVTSQYGVEDIIAIQMLAARFYTMGWSDQLRQMDKLGLTPKGKRDLRWRTPNEVKTIAKQQKKAEVRRLHAVGKTVKK